MFDTLYFLANPIPSNNLTGISNTNSILILCANTSGGARFFFRLLFLKIVKIINQWMAHSCQIRVGGWELYWQWWQF